MARKTSTSTEQAYCFAADTCAVTTEHGAPVILNRGELWDASDPLVAHAPWAFTAEPTLDMMRRTHLPAGYDIYGDPIAAGA